MSGTSRGTSKKQLLKSVSNSIRSGDAAQVVSTVQNWAAGKEPPSSEWDVVVGASIWNRCMDQELASTDDEVDALHEMYKCLAQVFVRESQDTENYVERLKILGATLKFFVLKKRLSLEPLEEVLEVVAKTSFYARQTDFPTFKTVCINIYALVWNFMRENHQQFDMFQSLAHASLSIRWLVVLGLDQFQNISHKLAQISMLLVKNQVQSSSGPVTEFFLTLAQKIVDLIKHVVLDDSKNGVKVKKTKTVLPVSHFYGMLNITFVLTRQLVLFGDFERALKVFRPITSVAKVYFDPLLTEVWKKILEAYVKISMVVMTGVSTHQQSSEELVKSSEAFRECRKQILDLNFQKTYPGYAFSLMYAFTECIGFSTSNSRNAGSSAAGSAEGGGGAPLLKQLSVSRAVKFLKEIQFASDACVALENTSSGKPVLDGITETRKVDVQSIALFHVLKFAAEKVADKEAAIEGDLQVVMEACFSTLMMLGNRQQLDKSRAAEVYNSLTYHTCNIGYSYQRRKMLKEAMSWCYRCLDACEAFTSKRVDTELKINPLTVGLLLADCHRQLKNHAEGLRGLSKLLMMAPQCANKQATAYDIYEQIPWSDWSVHWLSLQKEFCTAQVDSENVGCQTAVDYMEEDDPSAISKKFASTVLRLEMNAYFSGRQTIVPAMLAVGQKLYATNFCLADRVLGMVSQAVGLWWLQSEQHLSVAVTILNDALKELGSGPLSKSADKDGEAALRVYLTGIVLTWKGLVIMRLKQCVAEEELEMFKRSLIKENPEKVKDKAETTFAFPGFSSLTVEDEVEWANVLIYATECFYQLSQMEELLKSIIDFHCPALAQISVRLLALLLSGLGDKINSVKAWYATFAIAKLYDRKGLLVLAASEILKILPSTTLECVKHAEKVNSAALDGNEIKHNRAVYYRLDLAKALACYYSKDYESGLKHLVTVYKFLIQKDNFDSTHHLMAEADYVLSLYQSVSLNLGLTLPKELPEMLCKMTPAGLAVKAYKLLGSLSREIDVVSSGWTDLFHNYYLLGAIAELSGRAVKMLKETGKLRDLKCFVSDAVYFMQRFGIVSRSAGLLTPLIEVDISGRIFQTAQIRIATISDALLFTDGKWDEDAAPPTTEAKKFLESHFKIPGLVFNRLEKVSNLKWQLGDIEATSFHYRNRSAKYLSSLKSDCEEVNIKSREMSAPSFLRHPLTCCCYTCAHLEIIPCCLEFLAAQAKYAVAMRWKISMAILELSRLHHQRAMFRILYNMEYLAEQLRPIVARKLGAELLHTIYSQFFFKPGFEMQLTNMQICPVGDIEHMLHLMNSALTGADIMNNQDYVLKSFPLEAGTAALFEYFVSSGKIPILDGNLKDLLRERAEQQEKENTNTSPEFLNETILPTLPPAVRKIPAGKNRKATITSLRPRRILNNKSQHVQELAANVELIDLTKAELSDVDRRLPVIPAPNFDDSTDD